MGSGTALATGATGTTVGLGASWLGAAGVTTATTAIGAITTVASSLGIMANAAVASIAYQF